MPVAGAATRRVDGPGGQQQPQASCAIRRRCRCCRRCRRSGECPPQTSTLPPHTLYSEALPWGQVVTFHPIDYRRLGEELCECVMDSLEGQVGTHQPPQHYV